MMQSSGMIPVMINPVLPSSSYLLLRTLSLFFSRAIMSDIQISSQNTMHGHVSVGHRVTTYRRGSANYSQRDTVLLQRHVGATSFDRLVGCRVALKRHEQNSARTPFRCTICQSSLEGDFPIKPKRRADWQLGPAFDLSQDQAVNMQLQALRQNDLPQRDHGIEVLYRFADFDPFARSRYFGVSRDLGQFERFRRIFHTPYYSVLLSHLEHKLLSSLQVSELQWKQRVWVKGYKRDEEGVFEFHMAKRFGGRYDGTWFTRQLLCDVCPDGMPGV